ncbi:hypothetical protein B7486_77990 [cyanobacterium TDX16]|nr:hypothetical protein B7486_77990 [cyanobacterium TDX16]
MLVGGGFGTLVTQIIGVAVIAAYTAVTGCIMWLVVKALGILRVSDHAMEMGLDVYEHGQTNWPDVLPMPGDGKPSAAVGD